MAVGDLWEALHLHPSSQAAVEPGVRPTESPLIPVHPLLLFSTPPITSP